jgi:hypothetical protein
MQLWTDLKFACEPGQLVSLVWVKHPALWPRGDAALNKALRLEYIEMRSKGKKTLVAGVHNRS